MESDPYYGNVYNSIKDDEWKHRKKPKRSKVKKMIEEHREDDKRVQLVPRKPIETVYVDGVHLPAKRDIDGKLVPIKEKGHLKHKPKKKKKSFWSRIKGGPKKVGGKAKKLGGKLGDADAAYDRINRTGEKVKKIAWTNPKKRDKKRKEYYKPSRGIAGFVRKSGRTASRFGYALPSPVQIWTLAWQKTSKALKMLTLIVFTFVLLFVPWGVFYYTGWAVGAAFMFLISLVFWVFSSVFNGIAFVLVSLINMIASVIMGAIIFIAEFVLQFLLGKNAVDPYTGESVYRWEGGRQLFEGSLIEYSDIAAVPQLMHIQEPAWQPWMNDTMIGHLMGLMGITDAFGWIGESFENFYTGLDWAQATALGCLIVAIPIGLLIYTYWKNRYIFRN